MLRIVLICFSVFLASCSFAPLTSTNSGRSVGEGNIETHFSILPVQSVQVAYGVTDNLDIGGIVEYGVLSLSLEAWLKYALVNQEQGHGLSLLAGAFKSGSVVNSSGYYVGAIYSYKFEDFEPYLKFKISDVSWDIEEYKKSVEEDKKRNKEKEDSDFLTDLIVSAAESADRHYLTYGAGSRIYVTPRTSIGLGVIGIVGENSKAGPAPEFNFNVKF